MEIYIAIAALIVWNVIVLALYGADKRKARKGKWRTSEATLIVCAFLMGGVGALLAMSLFRHKTKHLKFRLLVPLAVVVNIGAGALCLHFFLL